jgi:prolyl 4-hydroxylase
MKFSIKTLFYSITIFLILVLLCVGIYKYYKQPQYKGRGYCSPKNEYIYPEKYNNFITDKECDYIIQQATPLFSESKLVSGGTENIRKSETAWLPKTDDVVEKIIRKTCTITNIPFEHAEKLQVVKYQPGGFYSAHYDASCDDLKECVDFEKNGGQRMVTMIIYLNDDYEGGETEFPNLNQKYKLDKGGGLLFYSLEKNGNKCHPLSLHSGTPVISGKKYIANVWLREKPYQVL